MKPLRAQQSRPLPQSKKRGSNSAKPAANHSRNIFAAVKPCPVLCVTLGLIIINLIIYLQVRRFEFIGWDDPLYVSQNPVVSKGLTWHGVLWAFTTGHAANWHPLTWLSHMLDAEFFDLKAGYHHLTNVLFHIANSLLLFWLLLRLCAEWKRSAFVATLFAVHPLHVESVAWVAERKDVLSTLLLFLAILAYVAHVRRKHGRGYFFLVHGFFILALMAKPMVVTLPFILLLLDFWPLARARPQPDQWKIWLKLIREKLLLIVPALVLSAVTLFVQHRGGTVAGLEVFPIAMRAANAVISYVAYLGKMLWPENLSAFYPYRPIPAWALALSLLGLTIISILAIRKSSRLPFLFVGWAWYLGTLVPVIGLIQVGDQARADRYTYVPLIGIFIIIAWGIPELLSRWRHRNVFMSITAGAIICLLTMAARNQTSYWQNAVILWEHAVAATGGSCHAHVNAGFAWMERGQVDRAIYHYKEALRMDPRFAEAYNALGVALLRQKRTDEAKEHFIEALKIKPDFADAHNNLGMIFATQGKTGEALSHFTRALRKKPDDPQIHLNMGMALASLGKLEEAMTHYHQSLKIKPGFAEAHNELGNVLLNQGKLEAAIKQYEEALRIMPELAAAHHNLGFALMKQGFEKEAISHYQEALRINPGMAEAHNSLGNVYLKQGRQAEAIVQYQEALRINPDYPEARYNLGTALINQMRDAEAIVHLTEALRLRPDYLDARRNLGIALINQNRLQEAVMQLKEVLRIKPDDEETLKTLRIAQSRLGKL